MNAVSGPCLMVTGFTSLGNYKNQNTIVALEALHEAGLRPPGTTASWTDRFLTQPIHESDLRAVKALKHRFLRALKQSGITVSYSPQQISPTFSDEKRAVQVLYETLSEPEARWLCALPDLPSRLTKVLLRNPNYQKGTENISGALVNQLARDAWLPSRGHAHYVPLHSEHQITPYVQAVREKEGREPDAVLLSGVIGSGNRFQLETVARNIATRSMVNDSGGIPDSALIDKSRPETHQWKSGKQEQSLVNRMAQTLRDENHPYGVSDNAGDQGCNLIFALTRNAFPAVPTVFVHIPRPQESFDRLRKGQPDRQTLLAGFKSLINATALSFASQKNADE